MATLTMRQRNAFAPDKFAGPHRSFPIPDANHARLAIAMAKRSENAGNISAATAASIQAKARAKLARG